jgi:hypothetical protein
MSTWTGRIIGIGLVAALPWMMGVDGAVTALGALSGMGIAPIIGCVACLGGGAAILTSSGGVIAAFIWSNTSMVALAGCIALCADAVM